MMHPDLAYPAHGCRDCHAPVRVTAPDLWGEVFVIHRCHGHLHFTVAGPAESPLDRWNRLNPFLTQG